MEDFRQLFFEECGELINQLEDNLMKLEENPENKELINSVFRIMHSLKGSGAMFGFTNLSNFTHKLESLYDEIRSSKLELSPEILNFTIEITDHIKNLLNNSDNEQLVEKSIEYEKEIEKRFLNNAEGIIEKPEIIVESKVEEDIKLVETNKSKNKIYYINFAPNEDIFNDGTKPLYLLDELSDLGECIFNTDYSKLPVLSEINYEKCYLSWQIIISTPEDIEVLRDVFIFVEDVSKLQIELLSETDVFSFPEIKAKLQNLLSKGLQDFGGIKRLLEIYKNELPENKNEQAIEQIPTIINKEIENKKEPLKTVESDEKEAKSIKLPSSTNIESIRISSKKLDELINLVSEFVTNQARLYNLATKTNSVEIKELTEDFSNLARQFRDISFEMRLVPIQTLVIKFKRLVRDLSRKLNKKVEFIAEGADTELDKNIISTISDPIMHIIRNSLDHAIESPNERIKANKSETGKITLKAINSGAFVEISIIDDGRGIDTKQIEKKAIEKKLISKNHNLKDDEILNLIMLPGFSTNENVTDLSGRGVGMDVVKKNIESLRGEVEISSHAGKGTKVKLKLPLSLSIIDGLLCKVNGSFYILPLSSIVKIFSLNKSEIKNTYKNIITIENEQFPFINLCESFKNNPENNSVLNLLLINYKNQKIGLIVNEIVSEYQAVLKPVDNLTNKNIFSGASILGDGSLAMVIDTHKLIGEYGK